MKNMGFYIFSMLLAFMFAMFISVYSTIHYGDMVYMNLMFAFIVVVMTSFFLISTVYFFSEKEKHEGKIAILFFVGVFLLAIYASKAADATNMTKYGIFYTIIVSSICSYIILSKKLIKKQSSRTVSIKDAMQDLTKMKKRYLQTKKATKKTPSKEVVKKSAKKTVKKSPTKAVKKSPKKTVKPLNKPKPTKPAEADPSLKSVLNYLDHDVKK